MLGATISIFNTTMSRNFAPELGGAVVVNRSSLYMEGSRVLFNG